MHTMHTQLRAFAEMNNDYAMAEEIEICMVALDSDNDGDIGFNDYLRFAKLLKSNYANMSNDKESVASDIGTWRELVASGEPLTNEIITAAEEEAERKRLQKQTDGRRTTSSRSSASSSKR